MKNNYNSVARSIETPSFFSVFRKYRHDLLAIFEYIFLMIKINLFLLTSNSPFLKYIILFRSWATHPYHQSHSIYLLLYYYMPTTLFLIPPSEGKTPWGNDKKEILTFHFKKPLEIASLATEKDLKCTGKRYAEATELNRQLWSTGYLSAIERYSGVMYDHIWYHTLSPSAQAFFDEHFLILSGMYGLLKPQDKIADYKLPVETKSIVDFWGTRIIETILSLKPSKLYLLLPNSYKKLLQLKQFTPVLHQAEIEVIEPDFTTFEGEKITHNTKILRGDRIRSICLDPEKLLTLKV